MWMSVVPARYRDLRHQKLSKHQQNLYSIERGDRKRSKTPSHDLIDAVGGRHHHFEFCGCLDNVWCLKSRYRACITLIHMIIMISIRSKKHKTILRRGRGF